MEAKQSILAKRLKPEDSKDYQKDKKKKEENKATDEPVYIKERGLRFVKQYQCEFLSYAKKRWIGQTIFDIYSKEFKAFSKKYYEVAILDGRISVNGKTVPLTYVIKN